MGPYKKSIFLGFGSTICDEMILDRAAANRLPSKSYLSGNAPKQLIVLLDLPQCCALIHQAGVGRGLVFLRRSEPRQESKCRVLKHRKRNFGSKGIKIKEPAHSIFHRDIDKIFVGALQKPARPIDGSFISFKEPTAVDVDQDWRKLASFCLILTLPETFQRSNDIQEETILALILPRNTRGDEGRNLANSCDRMTYWDRLWAGKSKRAIINLCLPSIEAQDLASVACPVEVQRTECLKSCNAVPFD